MKYFRTEQGNTEKFVLQNEIFTIFFTFLIQKKILAPFMKQIIGNEAYCKEYFSRFSVFQRVECQTKFLLKISRIEQVFSLSFSKTKYFHILLKKNHQSESHFVSRI